MTSDHRTRSAWTPSPRGQSCVRRLGPNNPLLQAATPAIRLAVIDQFRPMTAVLHAELIKDELEDAVDITAL